MSITSCILGTSSDPKANAYYVVGTALVPPQEREPKVGRILVFQVTASKFGGGGGGVGAALVRVAGSCCFSLFFVCLFAICFCCCLGEGRMNVESCISCSPNFICGPN